MSVAVDIAASDKATVKREIIGALKARDVAGADVLLRPGTVVDGLRIVRCAEPDPETYLARFECERLELTCPLYVFLPRTQFVEFPAEVSRHLTAGA